MWESVRIQQLYLALSWLWFLLCHLLSLRHLVRCSPSRICDALRPHHFGLRVRVSISNPHLSLRLGVTCSTLNACTRCQNKHVKDLHRFLRCASPVEEISDSVHEPDLQFTLPDMVHTNYAALGAAGRKHHRIVRRCLIGSDESDSRRRKNEACKVRFDFNL